MSITVKHVSKRFRDFGALRDVSLTIKRGELVALLGPSGSGKTTLLRIIAGLEKPDAGQVIVEKSATQKKRNAVGFVFQHYALFKHMTVFENVAFGLRMRRGEEKLSDDAIAAKVMKLLKLVHLDALHTRYPSQLSGGQRQRIALARALAVEPDILLLDEPFGALDAKVRKELRRWMRRLHEELNITSIFVTHDQEEAMEMADRVVVMSQGRIEQMGTPEQVYLTPANAFVYDFLGHYNEFDAWQLSDGSLLLNEAEPGQPTPASPAATPGKRGLLARLPGMGRLRGARDSAVTTTYRPARHAQPTGTKV
ncbi:MAG: sulfate ABC transporter ATP-binding protein, partial [Sphingomonas sp.]